MLVGVYIAAELVWPALNFDIPYLTFSHLRPLPYTNAVIFAFGGSALFTTTYYVVPAYLPDHPVHAGPRQSSPSGWNLVILAAAITLPLGYHQRKEYAELEWPIDILITIVWVAYAVVFFGTDRDPPDLPHLCGELVLRRVHHHGCRAAHPQQPGNSLTMWKSYSLFGGVRDAMIQWWYGHNAVGFFLTAAFLGMMYYFVPIQANRPVYSYRLSVVHFWALISIYMWAGGHHLHYSALPDWTQSWPWSSP